MALHPKFPKNPYEILNPEVRWFPADEQLRTQDYWKLLPPLVDKLRKDVKNWRDKNYEGATETSKALLRWWFNKQYHPEFEYYFAQREAIETVIYLYDVVKVKDKYDLIRFDSSGAVSPGMFFENWLRFVIKMATGSGKTKVLSLVLAWCYFHKLYEEDSDLARNFLIITPNIIVLDRIRHDFENLKIFSEDPVLPEDGFGGRNWNEDFQITLHLQDELGTVKKTGNIFLTNIHRVFEGNSKIASADDENTEDYYLGQKPVGATNESKTDLGVIVRDIDELVILNDEAHHIHDEKLAWFKSIEDIHNRLKLKGKSLSLQIDVTATPKHDNGAIFVQTVSDYPLVEAIAQNIVKHPVVPDEASRTKLNEQESVKFSERYQEYLDLGVIEWRKAYEELKNTKKSVLFVMTDDTKNCDEVAQFLQDKYPDFSDKNSVLVILTKNNGDLSENPTGKSKEELEELRKTANEIDKSNNSCKAIVSVLMLKEGWDVRNVTTIVGLRAYSSKANILPEQTLGRGLRKMFPGQPVEESVSVVGTDAFMDFVESIKNEGVELEKKAMGGHTPPKTPLIVEIDKENPHKDLDKLNIEIPVLSPRMYREYKNLSELEVVRSGDKKFSVKNFTEEEKREIVFRDIVKNEVSHVTVLDSDSIANYQNVIGYFAREIMRDLRLVSGYEILYVKVKDFITNFLFEKPVNIEDPNVLRNLSEPEITREILTIFKDKINALTVQDRGGAEIKDYIKIKQVRPFVAQNIEYITPNNTPFNRIVADSGFELKFANFLGSCPDIVSFVKNYFSVHFKIDYCDAGGAIADYYPDFIVKTNEKEIYIIETKGREDIDDLLKIQRLKLWCEDINKAQDAVTYKMLYIKQVEFEKYKIKTFLELVSTFNEN